MMADTPPDIVVPACFANALRLLDRNHVAVVELISALTAINEYRVDLEDDAIEAIEQERLVRRTSVNAIVDALAIQCKNACTIKHMNSHPLNVTELHNRQCRCGAKVVIEGEQQ